MIKSNTLTDYASCSPTVRNYAWFFGKVENYISDLPKLNQVQNKY